jgi:hypothetical protein
MLRWHILVRRSLDDAGKHEGQVQRVSTTRCRLLPGNVSYLRLQKRVRSSFQSLVILARCIDQPGPTLQIGKPLGNCMEKRTTLTKAADGGGKYSPEPGR